MKAFFRTRGQKTFSEITIIEFSYFIELIKKTINNRTEFDEIYVGKWKFSGTEKFENSCTNKAS